MRRISFIEAGSDGFQMLNRFVAARVGTVLLSTILKEMGYRVRAFVEDIAAPDWEWVESSDLVCISLLTPNAPRAYSIGRRLRGKGIPVVMGGAHPTFMPEEALGHSDYVIRGEAERSLPALVGFLERGSPAVSTIPGLSYKDGDGTIHHNPAGDFLDVHTLEGLPIPDFSVVHGWKPTNAYPVSTSRGCPFECRFCSVIRMFGRKYRFKSVESTMRELRYVDGVSKATRFFVDDNFTANKARSKELLRAVIAEGIKMRWAAQVRTDVAHDRELLRLMADSGGGTLYIGFESIDPLTLAEYDKRQEIADIEKCIREVKAHGMRIHGMFVVGADADGADVVKRTVDFAITAGMDSAHVAVLTPFPGTTLFEEMKGSGRILHTDWSKYNLQHVVFRPARMSPRTLQLETMKGMGRFYSWKYVLKKLARLDLYYAAIGLYARRMLDQSSREAMTYLESSAVDCPGSPERRASG